MGVWEYGGVGEEREAEGRGQGAGEGLTRVGFSVPAAVFASPAWSFRSTTVECALWAGQIWTLLKGTREVAGRTEP